MSGTQGQAIKAAIIASLADAPGLGDVAVGYSFTRDMGRECIYGGQVEIAQRISGGRTPDGHTTRDEIGTLELHIRVLLPGATEQDAEVRAVVIGAVLEDFLALNTPSTVAGTLDASVQGYTLTSWADDDGATSLMTYRIAVQVTIP